MNNKRIQTGFTNSLLVATLAGAFIAGCDKEDISHEDIVKADLFVIIDSLGSPCGKVLEYEAAEELAYTVSCQSGHQYVISVNPQGRVDV